ncbi:MAG: hypothetical protein Q8R25_00995 [bacterium]|nr:hypothetical protein [bacterium]
MEMKTTSLIVLAIILSVIAGVLLKISSVVQEYRFAQIASYEECVAAGNPIMESYPTQCRTPDGRTFVNPNEHVDAPPLTQQYVQNGCAIAGCSGEICTEASEASGVVSACVYLPEFSCYKTARCERQGDGKCGWLQTTELSTCIAAAPKIEVEPMSD